MLAGVRTSACPFQRLRHGHPFLGFFFALHGLHVAGTSATRQLDHANILLPFKETR